MGDIPTMPYIPFIPVVILGLLVNPYCQAQDAATPPPAISTPAPEEATLAERQLDAATIKIRLMKQIAASIVEENEILNQKFSLEGNYYKDFSNPAVFLVRLQLKLVGLGDTGSTMLQVCDGKVLWDFQKVLKMQVYRKKDILPILEKLNNSNLNIYLKSDVISSLGFGGPEAMMTGLRRAVKFDTVEPAVIDGVEVWDLSGNWIDRSKLLDMNGRQLPPNAPLPPYVPSSIHVFVAKESGWPYKIVMTGKRPPKLAVDTRAMDPISGRPVGVKREPPKVEPSKITLFYKLLPLSELNPGLFVFDTPADVSAASVRDETQDFLIDLDRVIQGENNRKKAEAAKAAEDPIINGKLQVGSPTDPGAPDTFTPTPTPTPTPKPSPK
jgi:hypothetical protein